MLQVRHKKFKSYSGPCIYGEQRKPDFSTKLHCERAVLLTEGVETGYRLGSIMAADGTGMTAGLGQHILVYPRELASEDFNAKDDQGGLGELLRHMEVHAATPALDKLWEAFIAEGWYVAQDGRLRWHDNARVKVSGRWMDCKAGDVVHGAILRDTITPVGGKVPKTGAQWEQSKQWAILFHEVFSDPGSLKSQFDFEVQHLVTRIGHRKYPFRPHRRPETMAQAVYGSTSNEGLVVGRDISAMLDLALGVFHSHTVNAPAIAYRKLQESIQATGYRPEQARGGTGEIALARDLLRRLATAHYGRWNEDIAQGRWARTRARARESGMWPGEFFRGVGSSTPIMPRKF